MDHHEKGIEIIRTAKKWILESVGNQCVEGTVRLRVWAQSLDPDHLATWTVAIRLVSRDGIEERGVLLPLTTGAENESFTTDLKAHVIGPLALSPVSTQEGDRVVIELGSRGAAHIEIRDDEQSWCKFSADLLFEDLTTHFSQLRQNRKIGKCIYCRSAEGPLSREHIIPRGLKGEFTLTEASCGGCRGITSEIERRVLRENWGPARTTLNLPTSRPNSRPTDLTINTGHGAEIAKIGVPIEDYPAVLTFPIFAKPGCCTQRLNSSGAKMLGIVLQVAGLPLAELTQKYGGHYVEMPPKCEPDVFARFVAKIGYGFGVLMFGLDHIAECYVLPPIRR